MTAYNPAEVERLIAEAREALVDLDAPDHSWLTANGADVIDQLEAVHAPTRSAHAILSLTGVPLDLPLIERIEWLAKARPIWDDVDRLKRERDEARAEIDEIKLAICRRDADHNEEVGMLRAKIEELRAMLPNWSHAEALQQRDALIAAGVAAQAELRSLRAELEGRLARLESTHDLTAGMLTGAGRRIAELQAAVARMAPVVAAADAWLYDPCKGLGSHSLGSRSEHDLEAAVRAYSATAPAPGS